MNKLLDSYWFRLTVASLLAFGGCYLTLADTGVLSSIPFMLICGAIAAIVMPRTAVTAALFAVFSLVYSSVYNDTLEAILTEFTACMLLALAGMAAVKLLQHRNTIRMVASALCVVAALAAGVFFYGDILNALRAENALSKYISESHQGEFGGYSIEYDREHHRFQAVPVIPSAPTETGVSIAYEDGTIRDGYIKYVESRLMRAPLLKLTDALRASFPSVGFRIYAAGIGNYPEGQVTLLDTTDYSSDCSYYVYITQDMMTDDMLELCGDFVRAAVESGIDFRQITFVSGYRGAKVVELTLVPSLIYGTLSEAAVRFDIVRFTLSNTDYTV